MESPNENTTQTPVFTSLADRTVKYDLQVMLKEAQIEFDASIASRDLIDQRAIGQIFNLKERTNARN